ncbi:MAG: lipase family protein [Planctomycetota bacterium]|nr:lipase family protein [Planctomycetota bacterium]
MLAIGVVLDVAIGLTLVYLVLSLVCSSMGEAIAIWRQKRSRNLRAGVRRLLEDSAALTDRFYAHRRIANLMDGDRLPSYIPAHVFADVLLDLILCEGSNRPPPLPELVRAKIASFPEQDLSRTLLDFYDRRRGDLDAVRQDVQQWFNDAMDRVSGWYRRWMAKVLFACAVVVTLAGNADTLKIVRTLTTNPALREAIVETAKSQDPARPTSLDDIKVEIGKIEPLIGWTEAEWETWDNVWLGALSKLIGMLLTVVAASLGAPFWFNALQKLLQIRASVKPEQAAPAAAATAPAAAARAEPPAPTGYTAGMVGFEPHTAVHNVNNAFWLGRAAELAYETADRIAETTRGWGMKSAFVEDESTDTQLFVAGDASAVLVAFRGTQTDGLQDILTDLNVKQVAWEEGGEVHAGFKKALDAVWPEAIETIDAFRSEGQSLWFCGHSLGGALATLALSRHGAAHGLYTIGQPRVGDEAFAAAFDSKHGTRTFRYVNNRDIVPRVPMRALGYRHVGEVLYFDGGGRLHKDPGLWYRFLDTVVVDPSNVKKRIQEAASDHGAAGYVELLRAAAG